MNTSIHIPEEISDRLNVFISQNQISKNKFIVEAIKHHLDSVENKNDWHPDILNWKGVSGIEFELDRIEDDLLPMREEIL